MKHSNFQIRKEYYNSLSKSRFSSQTSRRLKSAHKFEDLNDTKTRFHQRIEKACTTMSQDHINKEMGLYRKEIERLEKENLKKDRAIFDMKATSSHIRELETELIEVYRVVYLYEGKIREYEKELKRLETAVAAKSPKELEGKVEILLESYRVENGELQAHLEEKERIIFQLEGRLRKIENKYFDASWKLSSTKREINNPLKKRFPNLRNTITINETPLLEKEKALKIQMKTMPSPTQASNDYQLNNTMSKQLEGKETNRFQKFDSKPEKVVNSTTPRNIAKIHHNFNKSGKGGELSNSAQQSGEDDNGGSPNSLRKIYVSPIRRYELNRHSQNYGPGMDATEATGSPTMRSPDNSRTIYLQ